jgi:hypothetical protein
MRIESPTDRFEEVDDRIKLDVPEKQPRSGGAMPTATVARAIQLPGERLPTRMRTLQRRGTF